MKRSNTTIILTAVLLFFTSSLFTSCKKDLSNEITHNSNPQIEEFLRIPENASPELKIVTQNLRSKLYKHNYVDEFLKLNGNPIWDASYLIKGDKTDNFLLLIPTKKKNVNNTEAFIVAAHKNGAVGFELHTRLGLLNKFKEPTKFNLSSENIRLFLNYFDINKLKLPTKGIVSDSIANIFKANNNNSANISIRINEVKLSDNNISNTNNRIVQYTCELYCWCVSNYQGGPCFSTYGCQWFCTSLYGNGMIILPDNPIFEIPTEEVPDDNPPPPPGGGNNNPPPNTNPYFPYATYLEWVQNNPNCTWYNPYCIPFITSVYELTGALNLTDPERNWLNANPEVAIEIHNALQLSIRDENPSTYLPYGTTFSPEAKIASKITIAVGMAGKINDPFDANVYNNYVKPNLPSPQNLVNYNPILAIYFNLQCTILKIEHPEWSNIKVYWEASKEMIHFTLDVAGMAPVIGEVADLANGVIYTIEGDGVNATLSYLAAVPIAGWAATGIKFAKKTITAVNGTSRTLKWIKLTNGIIKFGDRGLLRKVLGLAVGDARIAHHLIPWEHEASLLVQKAASGDFHLNEILNGIPLTAIQHNNGGHAVYNALIESKLGQLWAQNVGASMSVQTAQNLVRNLANDVRNWITTHPNESINNLILP
jgi:hypothetical protein